MAMASIIDSYNKVLTPINAGYGRSSVDSAQIYSDPIGKAHQSAAEQEEAKRLEQESQRQLQLLLEQQQNSLMSAQYTPVAQAPTAPVAQPQSAPVAAAPAPAPAAPPVPGISRGAYAAASDQGASYLPYVSMGPAGSGLIYFKGVPLKLPEGVTYSTSSGPQTPATSSFSGLTPSSASQLQAAYKAAIGK